MQDGHLCPSSRLAPAAALIVAPPAPGQAAGLQLHGLEVTQAIQTLDNRVRLIADKSALARLYIDWSAAQSSAMVTAELSWRKGKGGYHYLPAQNRVEVAPGAGPDLSAQRHDLSKSINFRLPPEALTEGPLELRVERVWVAGGPNIPLASPLAVRLDLEAAPPLRVRVIGLKFCDAASGDRVAPDALHFALLRSWLLRAYPVARVEWSQITVDADLIAPPFGEDTADLANAQLMAIRSREIAAGMDPRVHYYGLVADDGTDGRFMRGSAAYDTATRSFGMVASGPAGVPHHWQWDTDPSYGDWYGAHELGHTFQRRHPGFPADRQVRDPDEVGFPYHDGFITNAREHVGFDMGDPAWPQIPMRALAGDIHQDVMTYGANQWISAYTYEAILDRLREEDTVVVGGRA
jgi:hypothetical protein